MTVLGALLLLLLLHNLFFAYLVTDLKLSTVSHDMSNLTVYVVILFVGLLLISFLSTVFRSVLFVNRSYLFLEVVLSLVLASGILVGTKFLLELLQSPLAKEYSVLLPSLLTFTLSVTTVLIVSNAVSLRLFAVFTAAASPVVYVFIHFMLQSIKNQVDLDTPSWPLKGVPILVLSVLMLVFVFYSLDRVLFQNIIPVFS